MSSDAFLRSFFLHKTDDQTSRGDGRRGICPVGDIGKRLGEMDGKRRQSTVLKVPQGAYHQWRYLWGRSLGEMGDGGHGW